MLRMLATFTPRLLHAARASAIPCATCPRACPRAGSARVLPNAQKLDGLVTSVSLQLPSESTDEADDTALASVGEPWPVVPVRPPSASSGTPETAEAQAGVAGSVSTRAGRSSPASASAASSGSPLSLPRWSQGWSTLRRLPWSGVSVGTPVDEVDGNDVAEGRAGLGAQVTSSLQVATPPALPGEEL